MALKIIDKKIVGTIDNLQEKLEGKLPIDRLELIELVSSWGRMDLFLTTGINNETLVIEDCPPNQCYDLSKLDVSQITDMQFLFVESLCNNTDISNWDTSNVTNMYGMFFYINLFNFNINIWNISNVTNTSYMFAHINNFLQDNINLNITNVTKCNNMFTSSKPYAAKYNNNIPLPEDTEKIKEWFKENNDKINAINLKNRYGKEIDDFFSNIKRMDNGIRSHK